MNVFSMVPFGGGMVPFGGGAGLGDHSFRDDPSSARQTPPTEKCNPAWDPGCPRPLPEMTMVPYVPSSYLQGPEIVYSRSDARPRPRDRSGRLY